MMDHVREHAHVLACIISAASVAYAIYTRIQLGKLKGLVNPSIQKDSSKVVHTYDVEDMDPKTAYCRCWRSKKFPYCDGSHKEYNEQSNDNVGPLIIQKKSA